MKLFYGIGGAEFLGKIAVELEQALARRIKHGVPGSASASILAQGEGWAVHDVLCTHGPQDRSFEERHRDVCIAVVAAGTFQYRSGAGLSFMAPGSLLLGNAGQSFECAHEHGAGDRCISFHYEPGYFERLASGAGASATNLPFRRLRLPPLPASSWLIAQACAGLDGSAFLSWEELGVHVAAKAIQVLRDSPALSPEVPSRSLARVTQAIRTIEEHPVAEHSLASLAREARLSPYHFLRIFELLVGVTPHRYVMRTRLREAAMRLAASRRLPPPRVVDLALDCGFGDLSHFNHAFRAEFGCSPRVYRAKGSPFAGTAGAS